MASKSAKADTKKRRATEKLNQERYRLASKIVEAYGRVYAQTGNPLFVWEAFRFYRKQRLLMPDWVAQYFETTCEKLLVTARKGESSDQAADIASALGFRGKSRGFSEYSKIWDIDAMLGAYLELRRGGKSKRAAFDETAERFSLKDGRSVASKIELFLNALGSDIAAVEKKRGVST